MKKTFLIAALMIGLSGCAYCAPTQPSSNNTQSDIHQKACQNVFSLINIDLSLMSPRGAAADVSVSDLDKPNCPPPSPKDNIVPITTKKDLKLDLSAQKIQPKAEDKKEKTSLFRLDLLHLFKIQLF